MKQCCCESIVLTCLGLTGIFDVRNMLDRFLQVGIINLHATLFKQELIGTIEATQVEFALDW